jgi:hypothetical protein
MFSIYACDICFFFSNVGIFGFDGCIRDVQFGTISWDLNDHERGKGVVRGCPAKVSPAEWEKSVYGFTSLFDLTKS